MTGGLLQLVATGIDSIFLTSNPSVTLFKIVYRRHTNFTLTNRTKQISHIKDFGIEGSYKLEKEADCIHKMWLNLNISDFKFEYPKPTYQFIKDIYAKYKIEYVSMHEPDYIVTYNDYITEVLDNFTKHIDEQTIYNNDVLSLKNTIATLNTPYNEFIARIDVIIQACIDNLYTSYSVDASGAHVFDENQNPIPGSIYMIAFKLLMIKKMLGEGHQDGDYIYLYNNYYNVPEYIFDNLEYVYGYAINRNTNDDGTKLNINTWVNNYTDDLFYNMMQIINLQNVYVTNSLDNNLQNLKHSILKFIDVLKYILNLITTILNGENPNNLNELDFRRTQNEIALFTNIVTNIDSVNKYITQNTYFKIQYEEIFDYLYAQVTTTYNDYYNLFFNEDGTTKNNIITTELLINASFSVDDVIQISKYSFEVILQSININIELLCTFGHMNKEISELIDTTITDIPRYNFIQKNLFYMLNTYLNDLLTTPTFNEKIYSISEINDILYNEYITELTYSIDGMKVYDENFNYIDSSGNIIYTKEELYDNINLLYLSFILIYIIESSIPYNKNMVDISGNYLGNMYDTSRYYGYTMLDYFNAIIESNNNPLIPILNFTDVEIESTDYKGLDTHIILTKFLKSSDIIYNEQSFNDTFVYSLTQTLKQNLFSNIHILYNSILDNILTSSRHNVTQTTRIVPNTLPIMDYVYSNTNATFLTTDETDYYKFSFFKTFTNQISDTNKFTPIVGSKLIGLSDNFTDLFTPFQQNKNIYSVYFADDILTRVNSLNFNISKYYENTFFTPYFNDITVWQKLILGSAESRGILQNLSFDKNTGKIVNMSYYFDLSGLRLRAQDPDGSASDPSGTHYIDPGHNIYDKFILTQDSLIVNNMIILNYIPLHVIKDFADEIYNVLINEITVNKTFSQELLGHMHLFDFRDLNDYLVTDQYGGDINREEVIKSNLIFKYDLYRDIILKVILRYNKDGISDPTKDFNYQVFTGDIFRFADSDYLFQYANTYLTENKLAIMSLLRPENLIDISKDFESDILVSQLYYDENDNVQTEYVQKSLYVPLIRAIIERYRIKFMKIINSSYDPNTGIFDGSGTVITGEQIVTLKNLINSILNNYIKFDNVQNIENDNYSYTSYKSNGYSFNFIDYQTTSNLNNLKIYKQKKYDYVQAGSSIYSYLNKLMIRDYNSMFNNLLISDTYYTKNLGQNMLKMYYFIKSQFTDPSGNNLPFYNQDQVQYNFTYKFINPDIYSSTIDLYELKTINDDMTNLTYPIDTYGFDYYSFGDDIILENNMFGYSVTVLQRVFYHTIYEPTFEYPSDLSVLDNEYYITMSFLGYDIRRSKLYTDITSPSDFVYKVPQYISYYSDLLRIRNKYLDNSNTVLKSLEEILNIYNDYDTNTSTYLYYSGAEVAIANRVKQYMLANYKILYDIIISTGNVDIEKMSIDEYLYLFTLTPNQLTKLYNINNMVVVDVVGSNIVITPSPTNIYNVFQKSYNLKETTSLSDLQYAYNEIWGNTITYILDNILKTKNKTLMFDNFKYKSDVVKYCISMLIQQSNFDIFYNLATPLISDYNTAINFNVNNTKLSIFNNILEITKLRLESNPITNDNPITFTYLLPYIENLYLIPDFYTETDILYHGSKVDLYLRKITRQDPVNYCWVKELGNYLIENLSFNLDELLIDEMNSNLKSLMHKIEGNREQQKAYNINIGNLEYLQKYDDKQKGNITLRIPLEFWFYKDSSLAIPMINLLYTKGVIKFKLRNLEDLILYDPDATLVKRPKIKTSLDIQYIYLEEEERKRVAASKMEFLIERYRYGGLYNYNYSHIIDGKIRTQLKLADPTKYILWRLKVKYPDRNQNNFTWNMNGYYTQDFYNSYKNLKTVDNIKVYFNGSTREQGTAELFNLINPHNRTIGSLGYDEYIYIFALYPLLYQPSGTANLTNIEDIIIEFELNKDFINAIVTNGLNFEIEYWAYGYNVLRFISGMCAPIFYV